ncbi:hypothetical protein VTO42DRAFT_6537 [Malbranchea cinnamomea]
MSSTAFSAAPTSTTSSAPSPAPSTAETASKPKPCCVCKAEKAARDDCMLFSKSDNPAETECKTLVEQYRGCMASYGFKI